MNDDDDDIRTSRHGLLYTSTGIPGSVARVTVVIRLGLEQSYSAIPLGLLEAHFTFLPQC